MSQITNILSRVSSANAALIRTNKALKKAQANYQRDWQEKQAAERALTDHLNGVNQEEPQAEAPEDRESQVARQEAEFAEAITTATPVQSEDAGFSVDYCGVVQTSRSALTA